MDKKQPAAPAYPWRCATAGVMGSGRCTATQPADSGNLKTRVNNMEGKPNEPLSQPSGPCVMCMTCSKHTNQQEAMASMLSTQARVLDSLQKNVLEIQRTLESLMRGMEERGLQTITEKLSLPVGLQQRRKSLPMRMLVDEVYVQLDANTHEQSVLTGPLRDIDSNSPDISGHKEAKMAAVPKTKQERGLQSPDRSVVTVVSVKQIGPSTSCLQASLMSKNAISEGRTVTTTSTLKTTVASSSRPIDCPGAKQQSASVSPGSSETKPGLATKDSPRQPQTGSVGAGTETTAAKADLGQSILQSSKPAPEPAAKFPPPPMKMRDPCTGKPVAAPANEDTSVGKQIKVSPAQPTIGVKSPPKTFAKGTEKETVSPLSLAPPKETHLAVPSLTTDVSSLRHVQSCPESLQRLQSLPPKADPVPNKLPLLLKTISTATAAGAVCTPAAKVPASGIQIRVSPAVDEKTTATRTLSPPKTALKVIDDIPPQPAPFSHRFVALKLSPPFEYFSVHTKEVLGGGRFGKVHKCTENATGLRLAAKIISTRTAKEKEMAMNEMQVMNQLSHANILQLYAAFEVKNQVILIVEYVEGGELFERIVDESSPLTEVDAMVFVRQICEGVQYMHQMYVLHLDLKPENILCVNRTGHQVKIIDFGLARRYKPREKLRVSFGTPEFLAPEVVNFDFVSFPTDMWTLGVITYMLVSGLSPFLGDDDTQTLNNVVMANWYFDEDAFEHISAEAKDFISNLLIKERSGRFSAASCLKHPWLNNISEKAKCSNIVLKSQVLLKKYMARRMWKKNYIAIAAANRFKKIASSGSLTSLGI
ncbi:myosin light chain kinase 2, skeletal/cardiac muscle [Clupea harengus]|uniref:Myosin light chain kinase 2, skeletal/cardiac muscle n=1 Tax=Clupea harengus TaxID=7950 RepID=A0A6P8F8Z1_CLUHA|nr:myosin light chain kinase 2, skeletal/cardiac muscle [Clupea harengus]